MKFSYYPLTFMIQYLGTETYRSGHNELDSKSSCLHGHVGSNPTVSAICPKRHFRRFFVCSFRSMIK